MDQNECKKDILTRCTENGYFLYTTNKKVKWYIPLYCICYTQIVLLLSLKI